MPKSTHPPPTGVSCCTLNVDVACPEIAHDTSNVSPLTVPTPTCVGALGLVHCVSIAIFPPPTLLLANTPIVYSASFTRLGTWNVVVPAVVVPTTFQLPVPTGYSVLIVYPVTAEPPSLAGAPHEAVISVLESERDIMKKDLKTTEDANEALKKQLKDIDRENLAHGGGGGFLRPRSGPPGTARYHAAVGQARIRRAGMAMNYRQVSQGVERKGRGFKRKRTRSGLGGLVV